MHSRKYDLGFFLLVGLLSLFAITCENNGGGGTTTCPTGNSSRTQGNDEFRRVNSIVYKGTSGSNLSEFNCSGWYPLASGDQLSTNNSGQAELNFSSCWDGRFFIFKDSGTNFQVETCDKASYNSPSIACVPFGNVYAGLCAGEFDVYTGSAKIIKTGTSLSITYLPEDRLITLVIVFEGRISVDAVSVIDPLEFAVPPIEVSEGQFLFTMPDDQLSPVGGLDPRIAHPISDLPPVIDELGQQDRVGDIRDKAIEDGVLPRDWPEELGGPDGGDQTGFPPDGGIVVTGTGGALADPRVQDAWLTAVDWPATLDNSNLADIPVVSSIGNQPIIVQEDIIFDPDRSAMLLAEAGFAGGFPVTLLAPAEDEQLIILAENMIEYLNQIGMDANLQIIPGNEIDAVLSEYMQANEAAIHLSR